MKIIILILGMLILLSKKNSLKDLFKTKIQVKEITQKSIESAKSKFKDSKNEFELLTIIIMFLLCLIYAIFYLLSGIYIGNFIFTIISIILILDTGRIFIKSCKNVLDSNTVTGEGFLYRIINLAVDFSYVAFMFYTIYLRW